MHILLLGASGFIGRELFSFLAARGHRVVAGVRESSFAPPFGSETALVVDLNHATDVSAWVRRLEGFDAVINCAGVLQGSRSQSIEAIHTLAPIALFRACEEAKVKRVIQISAISADRAAGTGYAMTKLAADERLRASNLDWVVLRPSLVHARGAYGGTALFRAMAALPFAIPVPGDGRQSFQPIFVDDLARVVALAIERDALVRTTLDVVGPDVVNLRSLLQDYRRWLGFGPVPVVSIPAWVVRAATWLGDRLSGPLNSTAAAQLAYGNTGDSAAFEAATGFKARGWRESLALHPSHAQDRWHARLYFVRPLLRAALGLLWLGSALAGMFAIPEWAPAVAFNLHLSGESAVALLGTACGADLIIGLLVFARWRAPLMGAVQVAVITAYTLVATLFWPGLWASPLGVLLKNLPVVAAALVLGAIEEDR